MIEFVNLLVACAQTPNRCATSANCRPCNGWMVESVDADFRKGVLQNLQRRIGEHTENVQKCQRFELTDLSVERNSSRFTFGGDFEVVCALTNRPPVRYCSIVIATSILNAANHWQCRWSSMSALCNRKYLAHADRDSDVQFWPDLKVEKTE